MGPPGGLWVFFLLGLAMPSRGQTVDSAKAVRAGGLTTESAYGLRRVTEITGSQTEPETEDAEPQAEAGAVTEAGAITETPAPAGTGTGTGAGSPPATGPERPGSGARGTPTPSEAQSAGDPSWVRPHTPEPPAQRPQTPKPPGGDEADPFFYDEATLRRRGLLLAAVLFVTGIVILTSGKCRQLSRLCRRRAYSMVRTGRPEHEDAGAGSQTCS